MTIKWTREQYLELMTFGEVNRQMFVELFGPLIGLEEEWLAQGAIQAEVEMAGFNWDYVPTISCGGNTNFRNGLETELLEENDEFIIKKDELGRTTKMFKKSSTLPLPLDYPVKEMDDWLKIKHMFEFHEDRIDWNHVEKAKELQKQGTLVLAFIPGGFDLPRQLLGDERLCLSYYQEPELMLDIMAPIADSTYKVLDRVSDRLLIDNLHIHEDMAGKSGPLIGPNTIEQFMKPYYTKIWNLLREKGTRIFSQDSDGNINSVIDIFLDCGVNMMYPMEPAAGMDIVEIRKKYGKKLALKGGIDKHVLRESKQAIREELEYKMQPIMQEGGTVFGLDHRIPNGTPLENYRYYVEVGRELLGLPPLKDDSEGWARMAF